MNSFNCNQDKIFLFGGVLGASAVESIAQAVIAFHAIDMYLKKHIVIDSRKLAITDKCDMELQFHGESQPMVKPGEDGAYSNDDAASEAKRCLHCDCSLCSDGCLVMQNYRKMPKNMVAELIAGRSGHKLIMGQTTRWLNSCLLCGRCKSVCPVHIDMREFIAQFRKYLVRDHRMPPPFHDFYLRDMDFSAHSAYVRMSPSGGNPGKLFFPGCRLGAESPAIVTAAFEYLRSLDPDTAMLLNCCSAPAFWAGEEDRQITQLADIRRDWIELGKPETIFACTLCQSVISGAIPEMKAVSLYQVLAENAADSKTTDISQVTSIFDPCGCRDQSEIHDAVRELAEVFGYTVDELDDSRESSVCCGYGGDIRGANKSLDETIKSVKLNASDNDYLVYCANCRDVMTSVGKESRHVLELFFDLPMYEGKPPTNSQKRENRIEMKEYLKEQYQGEYDFVLAESEYVPLLPIRMSDELEKQMDEDRILIHDISMIIRAAEDSGFKITDADKGSFISHRQIGAITYWVEYRLDDDMIEVLDVWSHRMSISEQAGPVK